MLSASVSPAGEPLYGGALSAAMSLMDKARERRVVEGGMFLLGVILGGQVDCLDAVLRYVLGSLPNESTSLQKSPRDLPAPRVHPALGIVRSENYNNIPSV